MTTWSASSGHFSVGVALSYSGSASSGAVTVTASIIARSDAYGHNFTDDYAWSGSGGSGSGTFSFYSPTNGTVTKTLKTWSWSQSLTYGSTSTASVSASIGPIWNGGNPKVTASISLPARPYQAPAAPTGVTASRVSDTKATLSWSISSTTAAPVKAQGVERYDRASNSWKRVATLSGSARSWTDTSITANNRWQYRVWGDSGSNPGPKTVSNLFSTTPAAPTGLKAVKQTDGSITVTWTNKAPFDGTGYTVYDNGVQVATAPASTTSKTITWTDSSPDAAGSHTYTVRMTETGGLTSALSAASNTVTILAAPLAPEGLAPTGVTTPGTVRLSWLHNPVDSSDQTSAQVQWRVDGGAWSTVAVADGSQWADVDLTVGTVEWQVRTWGAYQPGTETGASPWSAVASLRVADAPGVAISIPEDASTVTTSTLTVEWTYYQAQGSAQTAAEVTLLQDDAAIEVVQVTGAATSAALATSLEDASTYTVRVRAMSGDGLWSDTAQATVTTSFPQPPAPVVEVAWDDETGIATVDVTNVDPDTTLDPVPPAATSNRVERSTDGGVTWETIADGVPVSGSVTDPEALSHGDTIYRVTSYSDLPSSVTTMATLTAESWALWISGGDGFATSVALPWNPVHSLSPALQAREVVYLAGRRLPVELTGIQTSREVQIAATVSDDEYDTVLTLAQLAVMPGPFLYRDPMGRRIYGSLSGVSLPRALSGLWDVKATITETER